MNFVVFGIPIHFCQHELMAMASAVPFLGVGWARAKLWWRSRG